MLECSLPHTLISIHSLFIQVTVYVCRSGSCRRRGGDAALDDIEEIVDCLGASNCTVEQTGCLGACSRGPNALVARGRGAQKLVSRVVGIDKASPALMSR